MEEYTVIKPWRRYICVQGYGLEELQPGENTPARRVIRLRYTELDGREGWYTFSASQQPNSKWAKHLRTLQAVGLSPLPDQPNTAVGHYLLVEERETGRGDFATTYPAVLEDFGVGAEGHERVLEAMRREETGDREDDASVPAPSAPDQGLLQLARAIRHIAGGNLEAFTRQWVAAGFDAESAKRYFDAAAG